MTRKSADRRTASGFTLMELMMAVAIMTGMVTLVWGSFSLTARNRRSAEKISERYHQVRLGMNRMSREISMAYLSKNDVINPVNPRTYFMSERGRNGDTITFSSFAHMRLRANSKESDQTLIRYFVEEDPNDRDRRHLWRRESKRLDYEEEIAEVGPAYIMLEDVEALSFSYFDEPNNEWRDDWDTRNADGQLDRLPPKVRIELTVKDDRDEEMEVVVATRTFVRDPLWFSVTD